MVVLENQVLGTHFHRGHIGVLGRGEGGREGGREGGEGRGEENEREAK